MKDKSSFSNSQQEISKDLQDYINSLVEEVVLNNKDFATQKKYIIRYAEAESIDSKELLESLEAFLILVDKYKKNESEELKNNLEKQASKCYIEVGVIRSITNSSMPQKEETKEKKEEPRIKQEKKKPIKWIVIALLAILLIVITIFLINTSTNTTKTELQSAENVFKSIKWVDILEGTYTMGSPESEVGRSSDEKEHKVHLSAFKMSAHTITFEQYDAFCDATYRNKPSDNGWGRGKRPVINVSWADAVAFAEWLKKGVRLPTEAEWEYACRAGSKTAYCFGDDPKLLGDYGWYKDNGNDKTHPVGKKKPNAWGLYDMHGNVWEWCRDWNDPLYYSKSPEINPQGPISGYVHISRGGSWRSHAEYCRNAERGLSFGANVSKFNGTNIGFRLLYPW